VDRKIHWEQIYSTRLTTAVSWYQANPAVSLSLIAASGIQKDEAIIDVGGGASLLVDCLLGRGFSRLAVLDISAAALEAAKSRLGEGAGRVDWVVADVTQFKPQEKYALWHDRAVFHFLTNAEDRQAYMAVARQAIQPEGNLIIATFSLNGPEKCSGLEIVRYSPESLAREVGDDFELVETCDEIHTTPGGGHQSFVYCRFRRKK